MSEEFDVAIVGGGIAGGALATVLARAGRRVLVLEKTTEYRDRVRGEWIAPWGVAEVKTLGLYDTFITGGPQRPDHRPGALDHVSRRAHGARRAAWRR